MFADIHLLFALLVVYFLLLLCLFFVCLMLTSLLVFVSGSLLRVLVFTVALVGCILFCCFEPVCCAWLVQVVNWSFLVCCGCFRAVYVCGFICGCFAVD